MDLSHPTVAITYKDDGNQDGICSQLLRIYGIYAISRFLDLPYVHSPIAHLGYHGLTALENNAPLPNLLNDVNRAFYIPSDIDLADDEVVLHDMVDADVASIGRLQSAGRRDGKSTLIRILYPFPVTDAHPELYRFIETVWPFAYRRSDAFRLAIHVRRGECVACQTDWLLPNAYYVSCILRFQKVLRTLDIPFVCDLHTEVPSKAFEVTPEHHGIYGRITENVLFDPAMNHLEDFDAIPGLEWFINADPIESIRRMATADALIISHSSFSYLPAVANPNGIVVYHPYWRARMKEWLIADDRGRFAESALTERLKVWKRAAERDSAVARWRAIDLPPRDVYPEVERLRESFRRQSAAIRSVVAVGCHRILGLVGDAAARRFVVRDDRVPPAVQEEPIGRAGSTLASLSLEASAAGGSSLGDDLLLIPAHLLEDAMAPPAAALDFRAIAALFPGRPDRSGGDQAWRLRRSLFDRGLICTNAVAWGGGHALCFLASDAVRAFDLDVESRGHVTMSGLTAGAGFANQLWRYACIKLYALRHGLTPALPAWEGTRLFGLEDRSCAGFAFPTISYPGFADNDRELWDLDDPPINVDLVGFFQEIPECWRRHRALLRRMFQPAPASVQAVDAWRDRVTDGGRRTLVVISVRRGDYSQYQSESLPWFRLVPEEWYLDWLRTIWPRLRDPVLFVASDEPNTVAPAFREFEPLPTAFGSVVTDLPHHVSDFEVLRRADYLALCNSSFPRFAAMLAPDGQQCFLPSFRTESFEPYQPWMDPAFWARFADAWSATHRAGNDRQAPPTARTGSSTLLVDVSDLLISLRRPIRLSDTQRIQWELVRSVSEVARQAPVCIVVRHDGSVNAIDATTLRDAVERLATHAADGDSSVRALLERAVPCTVRSGDCVLVVGTLSNVSGGGAFLRNARNAGASAGVFLPDIVPIAAPELCDLDTTRLFAKGFADVLDCASFILTASEYNKASVAGPMRSAGKLIPVEVVRCGQGLSFPSGIGTTMSAAVARRLGTDYVLCAGPIEARTNPAYLFNMWKMMVRSGRSHVPCLVFAGPQGRLVEDFMGQLAACHYLDGHVQLVHDVTDAELDALYRGCMLTVCPSFIEGTGLPVAESLAHGKICIGADEEGIREAGGPLVDYVNPYNVHDGLQCLAGYLDHSERRRSREREIANLFTARSWRHASADVLASAQRLAGAASSSASSSPPAPSAGPPRAQSSPGRRPHAVSSRARPLP